jgi:nucleoside-diphosphate-sugar epimerase
MTASRYLVTGGSGFLGINLCRFLLSRGHRVWSLDIAPFSYPERNAVEAIAGDVRDREAVDRAMDHVEVVVHCAAALPLCSREEIMSTNVDGTRIVMESALRNKVSRLINISSTAVYGIPDHHPIYETDRLQGVGPYGESKIAAEKICEEFRARAMCIPVLRPKSFVGPERLGAFELLYDWAYAGRNFPVLGEGNNRYQLLDVEDLCSAIYLCATADSKLVNDTFNIGAAEFGTMRDNFQAVLIRAGHGKRVVALPARQSIWLLRMLEHFHLSPFYRWIYETAGKDSVVSIERFGTRLGFRPKYSNRDALIRNYEWYLSHRDAIRPESGTSHRMAWRRGALRLAKCFF